MKLDWNEYIGLSRKAIAEGVVLLRNENQALPLAKNSNVAVFGRIQSHYYKSGTGSGGMVNVTKVTGILDALLEDADVHVNSDVLEMYRTWEEKNPFNEGIGWGNEPWSQEEMPLDEALLEKAARTSDTALVIIGRTAGEEQDSRDMPGSYRLSELEGEMIAKVRKAFSRMVVILNVGAIIDMSFVAEYTPDAVLYAWQGGMVGGLGTVDVLTGRVSPSGKLSDTIAHKIEDYPAHPYFGDPVRNFYAEDIYVGYRYFETFAPEKVLYPFGFGLSYTTFSREKILFEKCDGGFCFRVLIRNTGNVPGKEVIQIYLEAPQGLLGKPAKTLAAFSKTKELMPGEEEVLNLFVEDNALASFDDAGVTGYKSAYVLEAGTYLFYIGNSVKNLDVAGIFELEETGPVLTLSQVLAPDSAFQRMHPAQSEDGKFTVAMEDVPLSEEDETVRRLQSIPAEIPFTGDKGYKLSDVADGKITMNEFIAQITDEDLACIARGEGMGSPKGTPGTAAVFGGVSPALKAMGVPCGCCSDGPSGLRMDCGTKAFSLPNGTLLACTFNKDLMEELFEATGKEMVSNKIDVLLGPGMNIHRHPLNGRNFEYFSEDPLLTGKIAAAQLRGLGKAGVTGAIKHFCGNNQETHRHDIDSIISERALREIYLKGFEIAVKEGPATTVMTTYGSVNGTYTSGRYDLNTSILRGEWGFNGFVMTDWWANISEKGKPVDKKNFAAMIRAQNDVYMVTPDGAVNSAGDNIIASLEAGTLKRSELQRNAANVLGFLLHTPAYRRIIGSPVEIEVTGRPDEEDSFDLDNLIYHKIGHDTYIDLEDVDTSKGKSFVFAIENTRLGSYYFELTGKSDLGELAQIPVTIFFKSTPIMVFTWNGTGGEWVTKSQLMLFGSKYTTGRLYFGENGIKLKNMHFVFVQDASEIDNPRDYIQG